LLLLLLAFIISTKCRSFRVHFHPVLLQLLLTMVDGCSAIYEGLPVECIRPLDCTCMQLLDFLGTQK